MPPGRINLPPAAGAGSGRTPSSEARRAFWCWRRAFHRHDGRQHGKPFGPGHRLIVLPPALGFALDALAVGEVLARIAGPVEPVDVVVEPELLGANASLVHHLKLGRVPPGEQVIVQRRGITRYDDGAWQTLQYRQQLDMILLLVVITVPALGGSSGQQIGRVAVDQLIAIEFVVFQELVRTAVDKTDGIVACEAGKGLRIDIDADILQRRRLSLHDRPTPEVCLDIGVMRRHHGDNGLA